MPRISNDSPRNPESTCWVTFAFTVTGTTAAVAAGTHGTASPSIATDRTSPLILLGGAMERPAAYRPSSPQGPDPPLQAHPVDKLAVVGGLGGGAHERRDHQRLRAAR